MSFKSNKGEIQSNDRPNIYSTSLKEGQIVPISIIQEESSGAGSESSSFRKMGRRPKIVPVPDVDSSE